MEIEKTELINLLENGHGTNNTDTNELIKELKSVEDMTAEEREEYDKEELKKKVPPATPPKKKENIKEIKIKLPSFKKKEKTPLIPPVKIIKEPKLKFDYKRFTDDAIYGIGAVTYSYSKAFFNTLVASILLFVLTNVVIFPSWLIYTILMTIGVGSVHYAYYEFREITGRNKIFRGLF